MTARPLAFEYEKEILLKMQKQTGIVLTILIYYKFVMR